MTGKEKRRCIITYEEMRLKAGVREREEKVYHLRRNELISGCHGERWGHDKRRRCIIYAVNGSAALAYVLRR